MAISRLFLSSILVAAFLGIVSGEVTSVEGTIFCVRNSTWSPLEGATARLFCEGFTEEAVTNEKGYFLKKLQDNTEVCWVILQDSGPNSGDCVVPDPNNSFDFVKTKYKDDNDTIYTTKTLIYNPQRPDPAAVTPPSSSGNTSIFSVKQP